jgi:sugar transferase (PEP-CTERM/EpsH1 system associated)
VPAGRDVRILFLTPRLPYPPNRGGEIIIFNFLKHLAARHEVALVSFYDHREDLANRAALLEYCVRVDAVPRPGKLSPGVMLRCLGGTSYSIARHTSPAYRGAVREVVQEFRPDLAQIEIFFMGNYLDELAGIRTVLHMHDVTWVMWDRMAQVSRPGLRPLIALEAARIRRDELRICRAVDVCVTVSETDQRRLLEAAGGSVRSAVVVPGVDAAAFEPVDPVEATHDLVFVGSMHYLPNVDAAEFFVHDVLPRIAREVPDVTFTIVGTRPSAAVRRLAADPRVRVTGAVADVRPYYAAAAATIVPLRIAGGVRMKILEAMAFGVPIVSTTIGAEGLGLTHGRELLLGDGPQGLAEAAIRVLRDAGLRRMLAAGARDAAVRRSWHEVGLSLEAVYRSILPSRSPA